MSATPIQANALHLPLQDESVDLFVTSPPYFALRSYRDGGEHYSDQIGSEATPQAFLEALWAVTKEMWRCLKPPGSLFVNLGDKRSGSGGHNNSGISAKSTLHGNGHVGGVGKAGPQKIHETPRASEARIRASDARSTPSATRRNAPDRYNQSAFGRPKSKMLLPHRFAIGCEDGLADPEGVGWIVRQDIVWSKPNGLPESVTDRVRDSHEYWFHLTKQGRYFSAVDEVREGYAEGAWDKGPRSSYKPGSASGSIAADGEHERKSDAGLPLNPLGKLPGSVWTVPSEPLTLPDAVKAHYDLPDHFAAFPQEFPRRLILGWSPSGVCTACGEGRRPVVDKRCVAEDRGAIGSRGEKRTGTDDPGVRVRPVDVYGSSEVTITGYACACPNTSAPTRPAVVADIFGGTGTVAGVARQLGRLGLSFDLSYDYCRLAQYFLRDGRRFAKTSSRTDRERQGALL